MKRQYHQPKIATHSLVLKPLLGPTGSISFPVVEAKKRDRSRREDYEEYDDEEAYGNMPFDE